MADPKPKTFPLKNPVPMVAPFWGDADLTSGSGVVWYQERHRVTDISLIDSIAPSDQYVFNLATAQIQNTVGDTSFYPTTVITITWQNVPAWPSSKNKDKQVALSHPVH